MNRWDEIQAAARKVAGEDKANELIELVGLMIKATGKVVAVNGESMMNFFQHEPEADKAHTQYLVGERMQDAADEVVAQSKSADLSRYDQPLGHPSHPDEAPVWVTAQDGEGLPIVNTDGTNWIICGLCGMDKPVPCCKQVRCALHNSGQPAVGGCCYLKREVCPEHH